MSEEVKLHVGATVWYCDPSSRVYAKNAAGQSFGPPLRRNMWRPRTITGETTRSWIVGQRWDQTKLPKAGPQKLGWAYTEQQVDDDVWVHEHRHKIVGAVQCAPAAKLRAIAALLESGATEETNSK